MAENFRHKRQFRHTIFKELSIDFQGERDLKYPEYPKYPHYILGKHADYEIKKKIFANRQ